ncbi:acyltransferase [Polluticaenibacter yanchengensis]|uniref:DapH/DapD/GlmU-related protein n=1 Tax=Polluticaenibacter yanchengensis TaxID=3014562 RepID=A0ABT4UHG9_9BACT|nr:DapH/DapD/GlmU-related protein [Chitinophagaceae bacterium LY-5]
MIISILNALLPSFLSVPLYRLRGYKIGKNSKVKIGTLIISKDVTIGSNVNIGPLCLIKSKSFAIGNNSTIKPLVFLKTNYVTINSYVQISGPTVISGDDTPNSRFEIGDHSRIFPNCWLETGEGIFIGKQTGIGGESQLFTHGYWTSYLKRGPRALGPIIIKDDVYVGWRSFITPNVTLENNCVIAANTVISKDVREYNIMGGAPARVLRKIEDTVLSTEEFQEKTEDIFNSIYDYSIYKKYDTERIAAGTVSINGIIVTIDKEKIKDKNDVLLLYNVPDKDKKNILENSGNNIIDLDDYIAFIKNNNKELQFVITHLRKFGIRLYFK